MSVDEYDDFLRRAGTFKRRSSNIQYGRSRIYNFDEYYRQHYGDMIREKADKKQTREEFEADIAEFAAFEKRSRTLFMIVFSVLGLYFTWHTLHTMEEQAAIRRQMMNRIQNIDEDPKDVT